MTLSLSDEQKAFVSANLPLAKHVASLRVRRLTQDDYHDAVVGLCLAALRFDVTTGNEFSTYAVPTIRGTMKERWRRSQLIYVPSMAHKSVSEATRARANCARVWLVANLDDTPIDHDWPDLDVGAQVADLLDVLSAREKQAVLLRRVNEKTLNEISKILKVSKERVRQIEMRAMDKLRMAAKKRGMEYPCPAGSSRKKTVQLA